MEEKKYNIKVNSIRQFFFIFIPLNILLLILWINSSINIDFVPYLFLLQIILSHLISYYLTRGIIQITVSSKGIQYIWLKRFLFNKETDIFIQWKHVKSFEYRPERTFDFYYINLKNRTRLKLTRFNIGWFNDDLKKLKNELPTIIEKYRTNT